MLPIPVALTRIPLLCDSRRFYEAFRDVLISRDFESELCLVADGRRLGVMLAWMKRSHSIMMSLETRCTEW